MNTTVDIYEKYKKQIDELTNVNPELGNFYKSEFLKKEAKRRGFKKGIKVKLFDSIFSTSILKREDFTYQEDYNRFGIRGGDEDGSYAVLFKDGQWAEIIDEKAELRQEIKELEVKLQELREKL